MELSSIKLKEYVLNSFLGLRRFTKSYTSPFFSAKRKNV